MHNMARPLRIKGVLAATALFMLAAAWPALGQQASGEEALPAGGLVLVANGAVQVESQDVVIAADRIRITSVLRNTGERDVNLLVSFAMPDLDAASIWEQPPLLPRSGNDNFVEAVTTADGEQVVPRLEQRATALGLDVTDTLTGLGIQLFPYASGLQSRIDALADPVKEDLAARGILRPNAQGSGLLPAWTLRSTIWWRQLFPVGKAVTMAHTYRPVVGRPVGSLAAFERSVCLDGHEMKRLESAGAARLTVVSFQATVGATWADPIGVFRLTIEKPSRNAEVATCRTDLVVASPLQLEWSARDHSHEDDLVVLFAE